MSDFLKLVQEATPETTAAADSTPEKAESTPTKRVGPTGILNKVVSGAKKISSAIDTIEKYGTGKWDIDEVLQKMLSKQLDKSTDKMGAFGKGNYKQIKLGSDIIDKINNYTIQPDDEVQPDEETTTESTFNGSFLNMINEAVAALDKSDTGQYQNVAQMKGDEKGKSVELQVWDLLKAVLDLPEDAPTKLLDPDPQIHDKVLDRRLGWITKGLPAFLKNVKEEYPEIPFTFEAHDKEKGLSSAAIEQEEEEFNYENTSRQDWIKSLGEEKTEQIVRGLVDIYPGDRIEFDEPAEDKPELTLTDKNALFELAGRTSFGTKGIQYTLKPKLADVVNILKERDIKYLTFLLQTNDNAFKAPESNVGIIYAYDNNNQPINPITTENVKFQWNGQEDLYTLSTENDTLMGVKYSEGQFPINKDDVMPLTDEEYVLYRPDEDSAYMKFKVVQDMHNSEKFLIDKDKGVIATEREIKEAEAVSNK